MSISRVAEEAGVSYAAAWRAINDVPGVSEEARQDVVAAMERLGFNRDSRRRHRRAQRESQKQKVIALLVCRENSLLTSSMLRLIQKLLIPEEANLIFSYVLEAGDLPPAVTSRMVDGVLGYGELPPFLSPDALAEIPTVWLMSPRRCLLDAHGDRVMPDHQAIGRLAAEYLTKRGHKNVAFLNIEPNYYFGFRGYSFGHFAKRNGATSTSIEVEENIPLLDSAKQVVARWAALSPRPTGLFIAKDGHLPLIYDLLKSHGARIGRDVETVSCDRQTEVLQRLEPSPVSIDLNQERIVATAAQRLLHRMSEARSEPSVTLLIPPNLDI